MKENETEVGKLEEILLPIHSAHKTSITHTANEVRDLASRLNKCGCKPTISSRQRTGLQEEAKDTVS